MTQKGYGHGPLQIGQSRPWATPWLRAVTARNIPQRKSRFHPAEDEGDYCEAHLGEKVNPGHITPFRPIQTTPHRQATRCRHDRGPGSPSAPHQRAQPAACAGLYCRGPETSGTIAVYDLGAADRSTVSRAGNRRRACRSVKVHQRPDTFRGGEGFRTTPGRVPGRRIHEREWHRSGEPDRLALQAV